MSFILDALHKAERVRKQTHEVELNEQSLDLAPAPLEQNKSPWFTLVFVSALCLILIWYFSTQPKEAKSTLNPQRESPNNLMVPSHPTQPKQEQMALIKESKSSEKASIEQQPVDTPPETLTLLSLPQDIRSRLPTINISGHIYSPSANKRMVVINNKVVREGAHISEHLLLSMITENGVELEFDGIQFAMSSSETWPY